MGGRGVGEMMTGLPFRVAAQVWVRGGACEVCWWLWWDCACVRPPLRCRPPGLRRCGPHTSRPRIAVSRLATLSPTMTESPGASARLPSAPLLPVPLCSPGPPCRLVLSPALVSPFAVHHHYPAYSLHFASLRRHSLSHAAGTASRSSRGSAFASFSLPFSQCFTAGSGVGVSA